MREAIKARRALNVKYELNDDFAQATTLAGTGGAATGNNQNATKQVGEPSIAGNGGGGSVWWQWTAITFFSPGFRAALASARSSPHRWRRR